MSQTTRPVSVGNRIFTSDEIARIRSRWGLDQFRPTTEALIATADLAIRDNLHPADRAAGWGHGYFCPEHVVQLEFDPADSVTHRCAVDGRIWTGDEYDGGWRCVLNARIQAAVEACATIWVATDDEHYLDYAKRTLLTYARIYPALPPSGIHVGKGKVTGQSLEEAVWALSMARAFDLIAPALTADEYATISTDLFRCAADHITGQLLHRIHNIECWHLACLGTLGVVLDDPALVELSYEGDLGLAVQLDHGILADGWWAEGSPNYHAYMLSAALNGILALRHPHPESFQEGPLRSMFDAPLTLMRSDLSLPALNDGWNSVAMPGGVGQLAPHYEMGYRLWGEQRFADVLHDLYDGSAATVSTPSAKRTSAWALWFGPDLDQPRGDSRWELRPVHPASGYAVLSLGTGSDQRSVMIKYGPHGGGHGHPDKLEIDLHAYGERLAPDAGSPSYNSPLQGPWFRHTLSHSTALVNHASQPPKEGRLIAYLPAQDDVPAAVDVEVAWPEDLTRPAGREGSWLREPRYQPDARYAGAVFRRFLAQTDDYIVDLFWCRVPTGGPIELALHHRGALRADSTPLRSADGWQAHDETYAILTDVREPVAEGSAWRLGWDLGQAGDRVWGHDAPGQRTLVATAPSNPPAETVTTVLRSTDGPVDETGTVFATVLEPFRDTPFVRSVTWTGSLAGGLDLSVVTADGDQPWHFEIGEATTLARRSDGTLVCTLAAGDTA